MNFPADINQWDYSTIHTLVTQRDHEPGIYDFKEVLSGTGTDEGKKKLNDSICKAICSMANTDGGYLIFGVKDPKQWLNLTEKEIIGGIPKSSEYVKEFGNKISSIHRKIYCNYPDRLIELPHNNERGIFVVHIPLSSLRPHMFNGAFYKRADTGSTEPMSWHEVRDQMLYIEGRLQKVRLLRLKIAQIKMLRERKLASGYEWERELARSSPYDTSSFETVLADVCDLIPSQTDLLENLVKLSRTANDFNIVMDPNSPFTHNDRNTAEAQKSNLLAELCAKCEEQLAELFGPLTADKT